MISSVDLRTGNKVYAYYDETCVKTGYYIETVESIQPRKIMTLEDRHWVSIENYSPIPLSPEILEKCDIEQIKKVVDLLVIVTTPMVTGPVIETDKKISIPASYNWGLKIKHTDKPLPYLHQLQNFVWINTGEELNINL